VRHKKSKQGKEISVRIKPIWATGVLIKVLRELAPIGFTWAESALQL
jgi:hypothetical protein